MNELSFEVAVPAGRRLELWACAEVGADLNITYGTEKMHHARGGLHHDRRRNRWHSDPAGSGHELGDFKKKPDYIGKRPRNQPMADPDRWKLVGLENASMAVLPMASMRWPGVSGNRQRRAGARDLDLYLADAGPAHRHGPGETRTDRMGEVLEFPSKVGESYKARIVGPVFYDKEGAGRMAEALAKDYTGGRSGRSRSAPIWPARATPSRAPPGWAIPDEGGDLRTAPAGGWMSPDGAVAGAAARRDLAALTDALSTEHALVLDVSDMRAVFRIQGAPGRCRS